MVEEAQRLAARYAIPVDISAMHRRAAWAALRGGRRLLAVLYYARAVARGDLRSLGRAAFAIGHPSVGTNRLFEQLGRDDLWVAEAEYWLRPFAESLRRRSEAIGDALDRGRLPSRWSRTRGDRGPRRSLFPTLRTLRRMLTGGSFRCGVPHRWKP